MYGTAMRNRLKKTMMTLVAIVLSVVWFEYRTSRLRRIVFTGSLDIDKVLGANEIFRIASVEPEAEVKSSAVTTPKQLPMCPEVPENLAPSYHPMVRVKELHENSSFLEAVQSGGTYKPRDCQSSERLAIIVPYRDRPEHLRDFLPFMHRLLQKQQLHYTIFVVEQTNGTIFNIGLIHNVGFVVANRTENFTCFIMHDVDLLPFNETNLYRCANLPKHMSHINTKYGTKRVIYPGYFGGVVALRREHFVMTNGYSNLYFGWGGEDDDFVSRMHLVGYRFRWRRTPKSQGYYYAVPHERDEGNPKGANKDILRQHTKENMDHDGLNSLNFTEKAFEKRVLYTWVLFDVDIHEVTKNFTSSMPFKQEFRKQKDEMI